MAKFSFLLWLAYWYSETSEFLFDWDEGNSFKSFEKHDVTQNEVEEVFRQQQAIATGEQVSPTV